MSEDHQETFGGPEILEHIHFTDNAPDVIAREREEVWLSMFEGKGLQPPVDLEELDPAAYIRKWSSKSGVTMTEAEGQSFNATWRRSLITYFQAMDNGQDEMEEWLTTGRSNGFHLRFQLMCLPPNTWFRVHAHPSMELITCLAGALHEVRLMNTILPASACVDDVGTAVCPNLSKISKSQDRAAVPFVWKTGTLKRGHFLANRCGSIHQSYTGPEGACLFLLWCGSHSNCKPKECLNVSELLNPYAGHASH